MITREDCYHAAWFAVSTLWWFYAIVTGFLPYVVTWPIGFAVFMWMQWLITDCTKTIDEINAQQSPTT